MYHNRAPVPSTVPAPRWLPLLAAVAAAQFPIALALAAYAAVAPPPAEFVLRAALVAAGLVLLIWLIARARTTAAVAGAAVGAGVSTFVLYPVIRAVLFDVAPPNIAWWLAVLYSLGCLSVVWLVVRFAPGPRALLHPLLNIFACVVIVSLLWDLWIAYRPDRGGPQLALPHDLANVDLSRPITTRPDVYHLLLDGFGRSDVLASRYGIDSTRFLKALRDLGFEVAEGGMANYIQTALSVPSMLNGSYIQSSDPESSSRRPLHGLIQRSSVVTSLKQLGYEFLFVGSDYIPTRRHPLADVCACPPVFVGEFEGTILKGTVFRETGLGGWDYRQHRQHIRDAFATLETLPPASRPRVVLAHIMAPHPPFVLDAEGRDVIPQRTFSFNDGDSYEGSSDEYRHGYRNQAEYVSARLVTVVNHLLMMSRGAGREAVIIINGDHGPRLGWDTEVAEKTDAGESVPVLLAIKWASAGADAVAPRSLVNVYRSLFRRYFNPDVELLPDRSFVSSFTQPYRLLEIAPAAVNGVK